MDVLPKQRSPKLRCERMPGGTATEGRTRASGTRPLRHPWITVGVCYDGVSEPTGDTCSALSGPLSYAAPGMLLGLRGFPRRRSDLCGRHVQMCAGPLRRSVGVPVLDGPCVARSCNAAVVETARWPSRQRKRRELRSAAPPRWAGVGSLTDHSRQRVLMELCGSLFSEWPDTS